ncbi:hypothetical protein FRC20_003539 [Serendipita sp. 405]|nr:hypothetical protein FRC20_003539 [Serendipita sp. 405]
MLLLLMSRCGSTIPIAFNALVGQEVGPNESPLSITPAAKRVTMWSHKEAIKKADSRAFILILEYGYQEYYPSDNLLRRYLYACYHERLSFPNLKALCDFSQCPTRTEQWNRWWLYCRGVSGYKVPGGLNIAESQCV